VPPGTLAHPVGRAGGKSEDSTRLDPSRTATVQQPVE